MMSSDAANLTTIDLLNHAIDLLRDAISALEEFSVSLPTVGQAVPVGAEESLASVQSNLRERIVGNGDVPNWQLLAGERLRQQMTKSGRRAATLLFYMMERPGILIPQEELLRVIGTKSPTSKIVKVYICHLRNTFKAWGWPEEMIETGRRSYALRAEGYDRLVALLEGATDKNKR